MLDDVHNIQGVKVPSQLAISKVCHMASCVADNHNKVPVIKATSNTHR